MPHIRNRTCTIVPSTSPCGSGLEKQRPNYYISQTLPNGYYVTDVLIDLVQAYRGNADITSDCTLLVKSLLCAALYAPCDNTTGQPLEMCITSCQTLQSIFNGFRCQIALKLLLTSSINSGDWNSTFNGINCTNPATYFYGNASMGFSTSTCYSLVDTMETG